MREPQLTPKSLACKRPEVPLSLFRKELCVGIRIHMGIPMKLDMGSHLASA
jgi:hypothetical protein